MVKCLTEIVILVLVLHRLNLLPIVSYKIDYIISLILIRLYYSSFKSRLHGAVK